jgi:hypothetical protein
MKKISYIVLILFTIFSQGQISKKELNSDAKDLQSKIKLKNAMFAASEIEVYISVQDGTYTTNELYDLFRGENPKIKLVSLSYGVPNKITVEAVNGLFPSYVVGFQTILYKLKITSSEKPTYIIACVDEQILANKDLELLIDFKDENCSGIVDENNFAGIEANYEGIYKKFDNNEKKCNYISMSNPDKTIKFRIVKKHHEK